MPAALITLAQWSFLPLQLCPNMMSASDVKEGQTNFTTTVSIGTKENGAPFLLVTLL